MTQRIRTIVGLASNRSTSSGLPASTLVAGLVVLVAACGGGADPIASTGTASQDLAAQLEEVADAIDAWAGATAVDGAHTAAESVANLVVGPNGPGYGDRDADGQIAGSSALGILPGIDGTPNGLALAANSDTPNQCLERDILGGSWEDAAQRWDDVDDVLGRWTPSTNTMPELASHPQRMVGWARLTLASDSLETAHEFAGHARLHLDISTRAIDCR